MITLLSVLKAFEFKGLNKDAYYKPEDILAALDKLGGKEFNREVAELIVQSILAELAQTILDAIHILKDKAQKTDGQVKSYRELREHSEQQLSTTSVYADARYLFVTLIQILNVPLKLKYTNCYMNIILGQSSQIAKPIPQFDKMNPEFNLEFEFLIPPLMSLLTIQFYITNETSTPTLVGQATLQLQTLEDQVVKEANLLFKDPVGREIGAEVQIEALVVMNKHQHLQSQLQKYDQKIFQLQQDLKEYNDDLEVIQKPFIISAQQLMEKKNGVPIFSAWQAEVPQQSRAQVLNQSQQQEQAADLIQAPLTQNEMVQQSQLQQESLIFEAEQPSEELNYGIYVFLIYGLITMFVCFAKPSSFIDLLVNYGMLFIIMLDKFEPQYVKVVGIALVLSIFYDIIWMKQYHEWWSSNDVNNPEWGLEAINLLRFVLLFTYIQFLFKFIVCYYLYHFYKAAEDPTKSYVFTLWKLRFKVGKNKVKEGWQ